MPALQYGRARKGETIARVHCPYCGGRAVLVDSAEVYGGRSYGNIWLCRPCSAWVGVHAGSPTYQPLGRLADANLRRAKMQAHAAFDPLWRQPPNSAKAGARKRAYAWLAAAMGLTARQTHIGAFDEAQCARVVELCETAREANPDFCFQGVSDGQGTGAARPA
jgi:hypothetical protein